MNLVQDFAYGLVKKFACELYSGVDGTKVFNFL